MKNLTLVQDASGQVTVVSEAALFSSHLALYKDLVADVPDGLTSVEVWRSARGKVKGKLVKSGKNARSLQEAVDSFVSPFDAAKEESEEDLEDFTREELYDRATELLIEGRSSMDKEQLLEAVRIAEDPEVIAAKEAAAKEAAAKEAAAKEAAAKEAAAKEAAAKEAAAKEAAAKEAAAKEAAAKEAAAKEAAAKEAAAKEAAAKEAAAKEAAAKEAAAKEAAAKEAAAKEAAAKEAAAKEAAAKEAAAKEAAAKEAAAKSKSSDQKKDGK